MYPSMAGRHRIKIKPGSSSLFYVYEERIRKLGLNGTAFDILERCNGQTSIPSIVDALCEKYREKRAVAEEFVTEFVTGSVAMNVLRVDAEPSEAAPRVVGSRDYFAPDNIIWELSYDCPLRCDHCYTDGRERAPMSGEMALDLCRQMDNLGVAFVQITGGEPLLYADLDAVVALLVESGLTVGINSSGILPFRQTLIDLVRTSGGMTEISIDGDEQSHDRMRRRPGSRAAALHTVRTLVGKGVSVDVATCVTRDNRDSVEQLTRDLKSIGVRRHRIGSIMMQGRAVPNGIYSSAQDIRAMNQLKNHLKAVYEDERFKVESNEDFDPGLSDAQTNCGAGLHSLRIDPAGIVHPCVMFQLPIGDLHEMALQEIVLRNWRRFRDMPAPSTHVCGTCQNADLCRNCFAQGFINGNHVRACSWLRALAGTEKRATTCP